MTLGSILTYAGALASLICFIFVLFRMFQNGKVILAIACIVLAFACGIGTIVAFIYGWMKSKEWNLSMVMLIWTAALVIFVVGNILTPAYKFD